MATISLRGQVTHTSGELPTTGEAAPAFTLLDVNLQSRSLTDFYGRRKLIYALPSLDTPVCAKSTRLLVEKLRAAGEVGDDVAVLIISADLPFAQQRYCLQHKLLEVTPLSLHRHPGFADDYGLMITDGPLAGLTARAILVVDDKDTVRYTELVADIADEPDYNAALNALRTAATVKA